MANEITNHWRKIFDPAAQIFLNPVISDTKQTQEK